MAIPFATTAITIIRSTLSVTADPYDSPAQYPNPDSTVIVTGIRAVVSVPTADTILTIGDRVVYTSKLTCDPCDLQEADLVTESSGRIWKCLGPTPFGAFFISGMEAELRLVEGLSL
jgi:hypothetical protein